MNLSNRFLTEEGRLRQRIGALQIPGVIREIEGANPCRLGVACERRGLPPQRFGAELRSRVETLGQISVHQSQPLVPGTLWPSTVGATLEGHDQISRST